jgi:catechol 2,3-dioxygenase-like lactoylglutathione lyase family enzyme
MQTPTAAVLSVRGIDHFVLRVRDIEAAQRFYCEVLGAQYVAHRSEFGMTHLRVGASMIDLVAANGQPGKPGAAPAGKELRNADHLCLRIEPFDQERIVAHLKRLGVEIGEIRRWFDAEGNGVSIYLNDPEGNSVELKGLSDRRPRPLPGV